MVRETALSVDDLLVPLFIVEGNGVREEITSMPGYYRLSLDNLIKEVPELWKMGLRSVLLFVKVAEELKDNTGREALNEHGLMQRAVKEVKNICPDMLVMTDVALDPYSSLGHDGIVAKGEILNDETSEVLAEMSVSHAQAGADFVAPSDMMDGRIKVIREALEDNELINTGIMAYSAKYASAFYGPFRDALDSAPVDAKDVPADKKTYQMDSANRLEAIKEAKLDIEEGADIIMVKPGLPYLDIVRDLRNEVTVPIAVYQVSGEYAMLKAAAERGWINHDQAIVEQLLGIKKGRSQYYSHLFRKGYSPDSGIMLAGPELSLKRMWNPDHLRYLILILFGILNIYPQEVARSSARVNSENFQAKSSSENVFQNWDNNLVNKKVDSIVTNGIKMKAFPGAQVLVAVDGEIIFHKTLWISHL